MVYNPWGRKESDMTEPLSSSSFTLSIFRVGNCPRLSRRALNAITNVRGRQKEISYIRREKDTQKKRWCGKREKTNSALERPEGLQPYNTWISAQRC